MTSLALAIERSITAVRPYTWNSGIAPRTRSEPGDFVANQATVCIAFATRFRWVSIAPFGVPVVPPVYWSTATSSGSADASVDSGGVRERSAKRWIHDSRGIVRGQWPAFLRSFLRLMG